MEVEYDSAKRRTLIAERGVDLLYAALIFEGVVVTAVDDRKDYGELREVSVGLVQGECFVVVHTLRGNVVRLITAWKGGRLDRSRYEAAVAGRNSADEGSG